jgi:DNA-binding transcriptional ArsR family regulator
MLKNKIYNNRKKIDHTISLLNLELRNKIYNIILKNPGLHFREIVRKSNIPATTLSYHLRRLEKNDLLITKKEGRYIRYFVSKDIDNKEKTIINIIRQETTRNILLYIVLMIVTTQSEIAKELELHPTTVEFHLKKLRKNDLIEPAQIKNGIVYTNYDNHAFLKRTPITNEIIYTTKIPVYKFLIKYYNKKYYKDYFSKAILDFTESLYPKGYPKKLMTKKERIQRFEKIIYEIFPHPYHQ